MNKNILLNNAPTISEMIVDPRRIVPILWGAITADIAAIIFVSDELIRTFLCIAIVLFSITLWLAHKKKIGQAILMFMVILTALTCCSIYGSAGIHDETVILFPSLLMFGSLFGTRKQFIYLFAFVVIFLIAIVTFELDGSHVYVVQKSTIESLLITLVILSASAFFANGLATDLRKALLELSTSKRTLQELNDQLELRVELRNAQLEKVHKELANAEKLASLGAMVAGISHELNTPIGNSLLAASSLEFLVDDVSQKAQQGILKKTSFNEFLTASKEISVQITRSSIRAAELISAFKQVAIDPPVSDYLSCNFLN